MINGWEWCTTTAGGRGQAKSIRYKQRSICVVPARNICTVPPGLRSRTWSAEGRKVGGGELPPTKSRCTHPNQLGHFLVLVPASHFGTYLPTQQKGAAQRGPSAKPSPPSQSAAHSKKGALVLPPYKFPLPLSLSASIQNLPAKSSSHTNRRAHTTRNTCTLKPLSHKL